MPRKRTSRRFAADVSLLVVAVAFALPLAFGNFDAVLTPDITYTPLPNSLILCGGATALTVACATLAAYPLSRFHSRFNRPFLLSILFAASLPITAIMVPVYALFVRVNLIDTLQGTILFFAASQLPFAVWLMKNYMDGVPKELEEAAWTDGASSLQSLVRIVLPLMGPGLASSSRSCCCSPRPRCRPRSASTTSSATGAWWRTANSPRSPSSTRRP